MLLHRSSGLGHSYCNKGGYNVRVPMLRPSVPAYCKVGIRPSTGELDVEWGQPDLDAAEEGHQQSQHVWTHPPIKSASQEATLPGRVTNGQHLKAVKQFEEGALHQMRHRTPSNTAPKQAAHSNAISIPASLAAQAIPVTGANSTAAQQPALVSAVAAVATSPTQQRPRVLGTAMLPGKHMPQASPSAAASSPVAELSGMLSQLHTSLTGNDSRQGLVTGLMTAAAQVSAQVSARLAHQVQGLAGSPAGAWRSFKQTYDRTQQLQAKVQALQEHADSLSAELSEASRRAEFAEARAAGLQQRVDGAKALQSLERAMQTFRRHVTSLPQGVDPMAFYERQDCIIGKGGCATVYSWQAGGQEWAVKADPISFKYAYTGDFEPERCADLLPAFLPPHPNIMAPRAWWTGTLTAPPASAPTTTPSRPPTGGFKLYTLYDRYSCSLWEHVQALHVASQQQASSSPAGNPAERVLLLDLRSILVVLRDVSSALSHLSAHRVVHCDIKPENILLVMEEQEVGSSRPQRIARAVLIDFGLARLLPPGVDSLDARGGTWVYKAPEQMSGPPGVQLAGQEHSQPRVCQASDVWSLGALICMLCNNGNMTSMPGLPFTVPEAQVLKWGDRPNERGGMESFYQTWDSLLPPEPCIIHNLTPGASSAGWSSMPPLPASPPASHSSAAASSRTCLISGSVQGVQEAQQHAYVLDLLRRLAASCMQPDPAHRITVAQVAAAAAAALDQLDTSAAAS